jgi:DNA polymerase-3 subunit beta
MEFKIDKATLLAALRRAAGVADAKSTMPILGMACLRVTDAQLTVVGTDLNLTTLTTLTVIGAKPGGLCVKAKALLDIVANLPGNEASIKKVENNWCEVKAGKVAYKVVGVPDRDFPKVPDHREVTFVEWAAGDLAAMLDRTLFSVCNDETRFHLNGVLLELTGKAARAVSTDGHRLSKADRRLDTKITLSQGVIVPKKGAQEVKKMLDGGKAVELAVKTPYLFVRRDSALLAVKLIDAQFPPYDQVIPKDHKRRAVVDAALLKDAVKRCALMASETRGLRMTFQGPTLTLRTEDPDVGEVVEELDCEFTGEPITVGVNPKYVEDLLPQVGDGAVVIELKAELDPIAFKPADDPDGFVGVVMPMRV